MKLIRKVANLTKTYDKKQNTLTVLKDVSLTIFPGKSVVIIGKFDPSKSTLMHLLALLNKPIDAVFGINIKNNPIDALRYE